jgi:hypothetical protein
VTGPQHWIMISKIRIQEGVVAPLGSAKYSCAKGNSNPTVLPTSTSRSDNASNLSFVHVNRVPDRRFPNCVQQVAELPRPFFDAKWAL